MHTEANERPFKKKQEMNQYLQSVCIQYMCITAFACCSPYQKNMPRWFLLSMWLLIGQSPFFNGSIWNYFHPFYHTR